MLPPANFSGCTARTKVCAAPTRPRQLSGHGVAYWTDGKEERILYVTPGYRLIALERQDRRARSAASAITAWSTSSKTTIRRSTWSPAKWVCIRRPVVAKNVVIVGAAHLTGGDPKSRKNVKGYVRGFDVRTGKRLWIFHTIPRPGEYGADTWEKDSLVLHRQYGRLGANLR